MALPIPGDARQRLDSSRRRKEPGRERRGAPSVLVVDDNIDARAIYGMYLRAMGCRVYTAADGAIGIERAQRARARRRRDEELIDAAGEEHQEREEKQTLDGHESARPPPTPLAA